MKHVNPPSCGLHMHPATAVIWGMDAARGVLASMLISVIDDRPEGLLDEGTKNVRCHCKHANIIHILISHHMKTTDW